MHHIVSMKESHACQDLLRQPNHVFLCEGLVVIGHTLVEDFTTSGTAMKAQEGKVRNKNNRTEREWFVWKQSTLAYF